MQEPYGGDRAAAVTHHVQAYLVFRPQGTHDSVQEELRILDGPLPVPAQGRVRHALLYQVNPNRKFRKLEPVRQQAQGNFQSDQFY